MNKNEFLAARIRSALTDAVHQSPATHDLLRGSKSAIEATITQALAAGERAWNAAGGASDREKPGARASLARLARFACENRFSTSGVAIRDILASIYGCSSERVNMAALTRMDDELTRPLMVVLTALLAHQDADERLYDQDLINAFRAHRAEKFFLAQPEAVDSR